MKVPEQSTIEKVFNNEATSEETREVVRWMATKEGQTMEQQVFQHRTVLQLETEVLKSHSDGKIE